MINLILVAITLRIYWKANKEAKTWTDKLVNLGWFWVINMIIAKFL
ncbi:hypothetical protein [Clostridium tertium]|nr:hypothetical protein [Clostridium tertium]MBP1868801.1 hypothetical protein [Clostridium tertium]